MEATLEFVILCLELRLLRHTDFLFITNYQICDSQENRCFLVKKIEHKIFVCEWRFGILLYVIIMHNVEMLCQK